jgi:UPF0176 protein
VSCPHCHGKRTLDELAQFRERQKQIDLAMARGEVHLGGDVADTIEKRRALKVAQKEKQKA